MTGLGAQYMLEMFQENDFMVERAAVLVCDPPAEAFLPETIDQQHDSSGLSFLDSAAPRQTTIRPKVRADYKGNQSSIYAAQQREQARKQMYPNGPATTPPQTPRWKPAEDVDFETGTASQQRPEHEFEQAPAGQPVGATSRRGIQRFQWGPLPTTPPPRSTSHRARTVGPRKQPRRVRPDASDARYASYPGGMSPKFRPGRKTAVRR